MKPQLYLFIAITLLLSLSFTSAIFNTPIKENPIKDIVNPISNELVKIEPTALEYAPINIKSWWGLGGDLADLTLVKHTSSCGSDCVSEFMITTYQDSALIDDIIFETIKENGDRVEQPIRSYKFSVQTGSHEVTNPVYEYQCVDTGDYDKNGTAIKKCSNVQVDTIITEVPEYSPYQIGEVKPAGSYIIKLVGSKRAEWVYDWKITTQGELINDWAVWNVTGMNNQLVAYWKMDDGAGTVAKDSVNGRSNLTNYSVGYNLTSTGILGNSLTFDGSINQIFNGTIRNLDNRGNITNFSLSYWLNFYGSGAENIWSFVWPGTGGKGQSWDSSASMYITNLGGDWVSAAPCIAQIPHSWVNYIFIQNATSQALYVNGTLCASRNVAAIISLETINFGTGLGFGGVGLSGSIDEVGLWNRSLTASEVSDLYNNGLGITYSNKSIQITLNSPSDNYQSSNPTITFNASGIDFGGATLVNSTLYLNGIANETIIVTGTSNTSIFTKSLLEGNYNWSVGYCDSDGACGISDNRTLIIDTTNPIVTIAYPTGTINGLTNGQSVGLNFSASDLHKDTCWYEYNGANTTIASCANTTFTYASGINTIKVWVNDTAGNVGVGTSTWIVTFIISNITYNTIAYETSIQTFTMNITYNSSAGAIIAILNYDGKNYSSTNIGIGDNGIFQSSITVPLLNSTSNKTFFWYINNIAQLSYNQTLIPINLQLCNSTFDVNAINFTTLDEQSITTRINATFNSNWKYWLGDGSIKKNYSYSDNSLGNSTWAFCITQSIALKTDTDIIYTAPNYLQREYHLSAANLSNITMNVPLYLLNSSVGLKFYFTVIQGAGVRVTDSNVEIDKYNQITGNYSFNSNRLTDNIGQFIEYLQQDNKYRFIISKNSVLLGTIDQTATCTASPCEITLTIPSGDSGSVFDYYEAIYANNTNSTLVYDPTTKIVTYSFQDLLSTAHYFRLIVNKVQFNQSTDTICDITSYTTAGSLTCDMSNADGDFVAKGYLSRSPEKPDKTLSFFIDALRNAQNSPYLVLFLLAWILTITFGALAISRGNPSTTMFGFIAAWTSAKLMMFNPFSWVIIVLVDLLAVWILYKVAT